MGELSLEMPIAANSNEWRQSNETGWDPSMCLGTKRTRERPRGFNADSNVRRLTANTTRIGVAGWDSRGGKAKVTTEVIACPLIGKCGKRSAAELKRFRTRHCQGCAGRGSHRGCCPCRSQIAPRVPVPSRIRHAAPCQSVASRDTTNTPLRSSPFSTIRLRS